MFTRKLRNRKVKDIFEELLGKENSKDVLAKIQIKYDEGMRGDELSKYAEDLINRTPGIKPESVRLAVVVAIAITVF